MAVIETEAKPAAQNPTDAAPAPRRRPVRWLLRQSERCFALIGLAVVVYFLCFNYSRIVSGSMHPTLQGEDWDGGDRVLSERVSFWFRSPRRWEVVTIRADDGKQIMKPLTVHRATQEVGKAQLDGSLKLPMRYSAGFMLGGSPFGLYGPDSHYAFGHLGLSNVTCWADPARDISVAILNTGKPVIGTHIVPTMKTLNRIADACPPVRKAASYLRNALMVPPWRSG